MASKSESSSIQDSNSSSFPKLVKFIPEDRVAWIGLVLAIISFIILCTSYSMQDIVSYHGSTKELIVNTASILCTMFGVFLYFIDVVYKFHARLAKKEISDFIKKNSGKVCFNLLPATQLKSIDAFCQLLGENSYFVDHPIVRNKGTLKFSSLMQDLDLYSKGTIPIRDFNYLKEILVELPNYFEKNLTIECINTIPENCWPTPGSGEKWLRFREYADFIEESLKPHKHTQITQIFIFAHPDDFTQKTIVLKSLANHWWRTAIDNSKRNENPGLIKIVYHEHADIRTSEPHICWRITGDTETAQNITYCLEIWPSYGSGAFLKGRDNPDHNKPAASLLLNQKEWSDSTKSKFELYLDNHRSVDTTKQLSIQELAWPTLRAELERLDPEYEILAKLRENWLAIANEVQVTDTKFLANHLEDWRFNGLYQEILELSRQIIDDERKEKRRLSRIFYHSLEPTDSEIRKKRALDIIMGHLECGVRIGLISIDRWQADEKIVRNEKIRDFNICGNTAFELTEFAGGDFVQNPQYKIEEYDKDHKEYKKLQKLWDELDRLCSEKNTNCLWINPEDPAKERQLLSYFNMDKNDY